MSDSLPKVVLKPELRETYFNNLKNIGVDPSLFQNEMSISPLDVNYVISTVRQKMATEVKVYELVLTDLLHLENRIMAHKEVLN